MLESSNRDLMASTADLPRYIHLTADERSRQAYSPANVQSALEGLYQDGLLILKGVVDVAHIDHLYRVMTSETKSIMEDGRRAGKYNQGVNSNILQLPPVNRQDCLFDDVWFNPYVVQVAQA